MASTFTPAGAPPPGVVPNFENPPDTLEPAIATTVGLILFLTTAFTVARLVARKSVATFALDDYLLIVAWALNIAYNGVFIWQGQTGIGRHVWDVQAIKAVIIAQQSWALELLYCPLIWTAKGALLLQLMRTFSPTRTGVVYVVTHILIWTNLAFYVAIFFAVLFECTPLEMIWNPLLTTGFCVNRNAELIAAGAVNTISDLLILILPLWAIWHLQMAMKNKLGISAIFATGVLALVSSIGRLVYTVQVIWTTDSTYLIAQIALWTLSEIATIILCACFPVMPRFLRIVRDQTLGITTASSRRAKTGVQLSDKDIDTTAFKAARCGNCQRDALCTSHHEPFNSTAWHSADAEAGAGDKPSETQSGIQRTVSIEMTTQKARAKDWV